VLITIGLVVLAGMVLLLGWYTAQVLLLGFIGLLLAIFLRGVSIFVRSWLPLSAKGAVVLVIVLLTLISIGGGWLLIPRIGEQLNKLTTTLPQSVNQLQSYLQGYTWVQWMQQSMPQNGSIVPEQTVIVQRVTGVFSTIFGALASLVVILFIGIYLAIDPDTYSTGFIRLIPPRRRQRTQEVLHQVGTTLRWWLIGKVGAMILIGTLSTLGLWLLDIPLALTLGLIAAIFSFIPNIGPTLSLIPAVLIALNEGPVAVVWVVLLYSAIQTVESYILLPVVMQQAISLPPALALLAVGILGMLFGLPGLFVAAPLVATLMVIIKMLYIQDTLGEREEAMSERGASDTDTS
jgi:predicted PurR-regulated permease PerM